MKPESLVSLNIDITSCMCNAAIPSFISLTMLVNSQQVSLPKVSIHLTPKWKPIYYCFVCMLIGTFCLILTSKFICILLGGKEG